MHRAALTTPGQQRSHAGGETPQLQLPGGWRGSATAHTGLRNPTPPGWAQWQSPCGFPPSPSTLSTLTPGPCCAQPLREPGSAPAGSMDGWSSLQGLTQQPLLPTQHVWWKCWSSPYSLHLSQYLMFYGKSLLPETTEHIKTSDFI